MNRKSIVTAIVITVLGAGALSASNAFAQSDSAEANGMSSLVQKIADKFGLNKDEVQAVFDESRKERQAKMEAAFEAQLSKYVKEGKITEDQKKLLLDKRKALEAERKSKKDSFKNMTPAERKTQMEKKRTELETWAKEKGIDLQYLMPRGGKGPRHALGGRGDLDPEDQVTTTPVAQ